MSTILPRYVEIAVNLGDPMFRGVYHEKKKHTDDLDQVLTRASNAGVDAQIITAGSLAEVHDVLRLADTKRGLFATAGCHPTRSTELESYGAPAYMNALKDVILANPCIVAVGECGLDYDRLHFSPADAQQRCFKLQLQLAEQVRLPLFLHSRGAHTDFVRILRPHLSSLRLDHTEPTPESKGSVGVVHSFTGTLDEMQELVQMGLYIGVNGCSLKTQENLDVVKYIPLHRIMLETDAPWCDIRPTHASHAHLEAFAKSSPQLCALYSPVRVKPEKWTENAAVKGRCEPCHIGQVAAVVAQLKGIRLEELASQAFQNSVDLFRLPLL